jgi:hypothetical protein
MAYSKANFKSNDDKVFLVSDHSEQEMDQTALICAELGFI